MAVSCGGERRRGSAMWAMAAMCAGIVWIGMAMPRSASADDAASDATVPAATYTIADVAWMSGHWVYEQDGRRTEELWMDATENLILGLSRTTVDGKTGAFEFLRVQLTPDGIDYLAQPSGKEATPFRLTQVTGTRAVFENPTHDFPQRIVYERDGNTMTARIEGKQGDRVHSLGWSWTLAE